MRVELGSAVKPTIRDAVARQGAPTILNLYGEARNALVRCRAELPLEARVVATMSWDAFRTLAPLASCSVAAVQRFAPPSGRLLLELADEHPYAPVLIWMWRGGRPTVGVLEPGSGASGEQVRWLPSTAWRLASAVEWARTALLVRLAPEAIAAAEHLPLELRRGLVHAWCRHPPSATIARVAAETRSTAGHLVREWRQLRMTVGLREALEWAAVARALSLQARTGSWSAAALALGTRSATLRRLMRRRIGLEAGGAPLRAHGAVRVLVVRDILGPLLRL